MAIKYSLICVLLCLLWLTESTHRGCSSMDDLAYDIVVKKLKGAYTAPVKQRSKPVLSALRRYYRNSESYSLDKDGQLLFKGVKVIKTSDLKNVVTRGLHQLKGAGTRKLKYHLERSYAGLSERKIRNVLQNSEIYHQLNTKFHNKPVLTPIKARAVNIRHQMDLMDMAKNDVVHHGKTYRYILTAMDVFSRFIWLRPLQRKFSEEIARHLINIYMEHGPPRVLQHDIGLEFEGAVKRVMEKLKVKIIRSSPYHPQSQGKLERSHRRLRQKIMYDLLTFGRTGVNWVKQLPSYANIVNMEVKQELGNQSPFTVYYGRQSNLVLHSCSNPLKELCEESVMSHTNVHHPKTKDFLEFTKQQLIIRKKSKKATSLYASRMIKKHMQYNPPSIYKVNEIVLVRISSNPKHNVPKRRQVVKVKILKRYKYSKYLVELTAGNDEKQTKIVSVNGITSLTFSKEKLHQKFTFSKKKRKRKNKYDKKKYYIPFTRRDRIGYFEDLTFTVAFNPEPNGNCQFSAMANQLVNIGIYRSAESLRRQVVAYLQESPVNTDGEYIGNFVEGMEFEQYLSSMSLSGTYGDQITLQAVRNIFNVQFVIVSTLGIDGTTLISPDGTFRSYLPIFTLGHFAEGDGEHYVCLEGSIHAFLKVINSRRRFNITYSKFSDESLSQNSNNSDDNGDRNSTNNPLSQNLRPNSKHNDDILSDGGQYCNTCADSENLSHTDRVPDIVEEQFGKVYTPTNLSDLPNVLLANILTMAIITSPAYFIGVLRSTCEASVRFQELLNYVTSKSSLTIYVNPYILKVLEGLSDLPIGTECTWSVCKLIRVTGKGSGLSIKLRGYFNKMPGWFYATIRVRATDKPGWFQIINITPKDGW